MLQPMIWRSLSWACSTMLRIPVSTQEPVHISPDAPNVAYEQKRVTLTGFVANTIQYMGPAPGYYWVIDCIQVELTASAVVATRDHYVYIVDKVNNAMRRRIKRMVASETAWYVMKDGVPESSNSSSASLTGPLYASVIQNPVRYGFLVNDVEAGDITTVHAFVREYRV